MITPTPTTRYPGLDGLRATAMLSVLVLHATMTFLVVPTGTVLHLEEVPLDPARSRALSWVAFATIIVAMPSFFCLSGYVARASLERSGRRGFLRRRFRRIGLPLLVGLVTVAPLSQLAAALLLSRGGFGGEAGEGATVGETYSALLRLLGPAFLIGHLWSLVHLLVEYPLALSVSAWVRGSGGRGALDRLRTGLARSPLQGIIFAAPTAGALWVVLAAVSGKLPIAGAAVGHFLYHLTFFAFGWWLQPDRNLLPILQRRWRPYLVAGGALLPVSAALLQRGFPDGSWLALLGGIATHSVSSWLLILGLIGWFGRGSLERSRPARYLVGASYWVYLAHLPVALFFQLAVRDVAAPALLKFSLVLAGTLLVVLPTYTWVIRRTPLRRLLGGG